MGYGQTSIVIYGVILNEEQTRALERVNEDIHELDMIVPEADLLIISSTVDIDDHPILTTNRDGDDRIRAVYDLQLLSHGTDSCIHDLEIDYDATDTHSFGIYCGSRGYAHRDNVSAIMRAEVPLRARENWEKYAMPFLRRAEITLEPTMHLVSQVW